MKPSMKLFIYCSIIAIIGICHNAGMAEAKPSKPDLLGQEPPQQSPQGPPKAIQGLRYRRDVAPKQGDEPDVPKEMAQHFRERRDVAQQYGNEPDMPKEMPKEPPSRFRTKRQIPEGIPQSPAPMPPM